MSKSRRWCPECRRNVLAESNPFTCGEHAVNLALTSLTCGLWLPVWMLAMMGRRSGYRCPICGHKT